VCICFISISSNFYVNFATAWDSLVGIFVNKPSLKIRANVLGLLRWALRGRGCRGFRAYHPNTGQQSTIGRPMVDSALQPLIDVGHEAALWNQWTSGDEGSDSVDQSASQWCLLLLLEEPHGDAALTQQHSRGCRYRVSDNLLCQISHKSTLLLKITPAQTVIQ
jgi:hypothetical protein